MELYVCTGKLYGQGEKGAVGGCIEEREEQKNENVCVTTGRVSTEDRA
jgi:hypothetical protein